jgi:hypothetical protein
MKTIERWDTFLGDLASGMTLVDAMKKCWISRADIETMTRLNDGGLQLQRWTDARLAGKRSAWSAIQLEDFFALIASGKTVQDAHMEVKGFAANKDIFHLLNREPEMKARYLEAKEAHMLSLGEGLLDIADDDSKDTLDTGGKSGTIPNNAAVARSKLKTDTRLRVMGLYNSKLFGEKKDNVQVNVQINHAEHLEAARERAKTRGAIEPPKRQVEVIDAQFSEKAAVPADDTSWLDTADSTWREEK